MDAVPYACLIAALLLVYVPRMIAAREIVRTQGRYDNHLPRAAQAKLDGLGQRAVGAHNNALEAFPMFAVGVLCAAQRGVDVDLVAYLALAFVALRAGYLVAYLADRATLRSSFWFAGVGVVAALLVLAVVG
jgi:uncharacterized MAPEG superfamily protein